MLLTLLFKNIIASYGFTPKNVANNKLLDSVTKTYIVITKDKYLETVKSLENEISHLKTINEQYNQFIEINQGKIISKEKFDEEHDQIKNEIIAVEIDLMKVGKILKIKQDERNDDFTQATKKSGLLNLCSYKCNKKARKDAYSTHKTIEQLEQEQTCLEYYLLNLKSIKNNFKKQKHFSDKRKAEVNQKLKEHIETLKNKEKFTKESINNLVRYRNKLEMYKNELDQFTTQVNSNELLPSEHKNIDAWCKEIHSELFNIRKEIINTIAKV